MKLRFKADKASLYALKGMLINAPEKATVHRQLNVVNNTDHRIRYHAYGQNSNAGRPLARMFAYDSRIRS